MGESLKSRCIKLAFFDRNERGIHIEIIIIFGVLTSKYGTLEIDRNRKCFVVHVCAVITTTNNEIWCIFIAGTTTLISQWE